MGLIRDERVKVGNTSREVDRAVGTVELMSSRLQKTCVISLN
jgi:hypothetical protein